uniref:Uncharacterized protein n=1 Tax=Anopheles merus TaxID=30066 RepID=A0A182V6C2_ANOME
MHPSGPFAFRTSTRFRLHWLLLLLLLLLRRFFHLPNVGRGGSPSESSPRCSRSSVRSHRFSSSSLSNTMQKLSSLVYSEMICFFRSCRLLMLKQVRSTMVRFGWVPPSQPALPFWNDCLNFFSLSKYSSRAALPGTSPYTTKYFFLFVLCFRWYPCSTTFSAFGMISDEARPAPDPDTPALLLLPPPVVVPGVADGVPDGVAFMPAIDVPSSGVPGWCWSLAGVEAADDDEPRRRTYTHYWATHKPPSVSVQVDHSRKQTETFRFEFDIDLRAGFSFSRLCTRTCSQCYHNKKNH